MAASLLPAASTIPGDAQRGAQLFESQRCVVCHAVDGKGGRIAPDLGKPTGRAYTPSLLATRLWNHAPEMWTSFEGLGITRPALSEQQAADLFAYFYALRYFEKPGDAARGRQAFLGLMCAECHSTSATQGPQGAPPVHQWTSLADPITLGAALWNHSTAMANALRERRMRWPAMTAQQLTDIMVYLKNLPGMPMIEPAFSPGAVDLGEGLFRAKGCAHCHQGALSISVRARSRTLAEFAVAMWNHAPRMFYDVPRIELGEMRQLAGYLWSQQYFEQPGNARRGERVYAGKKCDACHADASWYAPALNKRAHPLNSIGVMAALWRHGPQMLTRMKERDMDWPVFRRSEMADLIAYVNSLR